MSNTVRADWSKGTRTLDFGQGPVPADAAAMRRAREMMPSLKPVPLGLSPSFGFGDRIGLATPGHVRSLAASAKGRSILPIFPQQSIREMTRTGRSAQQVMDEALHGMLAAGYTGPTGADADHLKTEADVDVTAAAGFCFFTIDPSEDVDPKADNYTEAELRAGFAKVRGEVPWFDSYKGRKLTLSTGTVLSFDEASCMRAAVKYGRAIARVLRIARHINTVMHGTGYEIELSVDETPLPTTPQEHIIIAEQCLRAGVKVVSLAPRFLGDFEKGVDYKGDLAAFRRSLADHAAIPVLLAGSNAYKLSLHSGSDKLSIYTDIARATKGRFHVKTAGTSYLEALRVVARHEPELFRDLIAFGRDHYDVDKKTYHVSATLAAVPATAADIAELEELYLNTWAKTPESTGFTAPGRQILHCTFGSALTDAKFGPAIRNVLLSYPQTYSDVLAEHFAHHLGALAAGL